MLQNRKSAFIGKRDYFDALACYARCHYLRENGEVIPWIDENLNPFTGEWLARKILKNWEKAGLKTDAMHYERGKDYSHSTFADLIISGLCGIRPDCSGNLRITPLLPDECWDYFLLEDVRIRNHTLSVRFDRDGTRYNRGSGFAVYVDGKEYSRAADCSAGVEIVF